MSGGSWVRECCFKILNLSHKRFFLRWFLDSITYFFLCSMFISLPVVFLLCLLVSPQNTYVEILSPKVMTLGARELWEVISHERRVLMNGIHAHIKEALKSSLSPSTIQQEYNQLWTRKWAHTRHQCFDLALPASRTEWDSCPERPLAPSTVRTQQEADSLQSGRGSSSEPDHAGNLTLDFHLQNCEMSIVYKIPVLWILL